MRGQAPPQSFEGYADMKKLNPLIIVVVVSILSTGCSSLKWPITPVEDVVELRQQRKNEALLEFEQRRDWAEFNAAQTAWDQGDAMRCRESLKRLLTRNPNHAEALGLMAKLDERDEMPIQSANPSQPADSVQAASFESPSQMQTPTGSAKLAERARSDGNTALTKAAQLLAEGEKALVAGDCQATMEFFNQAMSIIPHDPQIPTMAAVSALQLNRPDVAVSIAKEATARFPGYAALHRVLGVACYRSGDYEFSQVVLQQALSLDNTNALTYFLQGCTLSKLGKTEAAEAHFSQAAKLDPRYAQSRICD